MCLDEKKDHALLEKECNMDSFTLSYYGVCGMRHPAAIR